MNEDADAANGDVRGNAEPALTERNTETIRGEEILAGDESGDETAPAAYGKHGGTDDATEEGGDGSTGI